MKLEDAETLALTLMDRYWYKFEGWSFEFDNAKRRCGCTKFSIKTITLSRYFVQRNDEDEVRETILHEMAHVIAGPQAGHGPAWRYYAEQIGAKPERCASSVDMPEGGIEGVCAPDCTIRHTRHRMPPKRLMDAYQCNRCYTPVTWVRVK